MSATRGRALRLNAFGSPEESVGLVRTKPTPLAAGQVSVAMEAAPINPSDLLLIAGRYGHQPRLPHTLGTEGVGRIADVGPGVDPDRVGDRVMILPTLEHGTWQDRVIVDEQGTVPVDGTGDPQQLSMLGINPVTAHLLLTRFVSLPPSAWIGQTAANSAVGRYVVALARRAGVRTLNVVRRPEAASPLIAAGADAVVVAGADLGAQIDSVLGTRRLALVLDAVGGETGLVSRLEDGGTVVSYAALSRSPAVISPADLIFRDIHLRGFWQKAWVQTAPRAEVLAAYADLVPLVASGHLHAPVEASYPIDRYEDALTHAARSARDGKVIFVWP
ncbi:zinc-dependent alcohol dehydrogenase family protein [Microbacterium karelineae]|uniref:zinc-dependent alcohol dehydrogenase family protein n=1 Tax=Microbacterium karelineae TaxID=2654283 RepID=UPI0012EA7F15|nr:zinc-dependent alcohol dehydrogenase family protein [Microbacterium karelineae]